MQMIIEFLKSDIMVIAMSAIVLIMIILYIINVIRLKKIKNSYKIFLDKLGNGRNIEEDIKQYVDKVENVEKENKELQLKYSNMENDIKKCIQRVGIVRYTAFQDVGSDLSFALALLDENNDGVVLNGIYSSDMSNIYAKPVENGKSTYTLSEQEKEAIDKAINVVVK